ncbi:hypothetical protein Trydic_g4746 [Trypoxylus dichotomus]
MNNMNGKPNGITSCNGYLQSDEWEEIEIPVPWGRISGKWWGSRNQQPIIALHGWQDNAGSFDNLAPLLVKDGLSLLCIDFPGHGRSSHYPRGSYYYIFWDGVHILRRIVKHFKFEDVILLGHSLGGAISFLYAATYPKEVKKYVSIDIPGPTVKGETTYSMLGGTVDKYLEYDSITEEKIPSYTYEEALELVKKAYANSANEESCKILLRRGLIKNKDGGYYFARDLRLKVCLLGFFTLEQILDFAKRVNCEVMNIRANPGMKYSKENYDAILEEIQKSARKLEKHIVPGAHHLHMDDAESIAGIICDFIHSYIYRCVTRIP